MTYLELVNAVLVRLREDTITAGSIDSNPYLRMIGSCVNDAKEKVEDAWDWSHQRGTDLVDIDLGGFQAELPDSFDTTYIVKNATVGDRYATLYVNQPIQSQMAQVSIEEMRRLYQTSTAQLPTGTPEKFAVTGRTANGNIQITVYPVADRDVTITVDRVRSQGRLVNANDLLLLPSLPVYSLATALASRERGEVGGTPTSEWFAMADKYLSDAIAVDSALFPGELDFYSAGPGWVKTNVRNA